MCLTPAHQYLGYADSMHMHFRQVDKRAMDICMSENINWNCGHLRGDISGHLSENKFQLTLKSMWTIERSSQPLDRVLP